VNGFSDTGSIPVASTSPEGRAAKNRGSSDKIVSSPHDGEFGFGAVASPEQANPNCFVTTELFGFVFLF